MGLNPILAPLVWDGSVTQIKPQYTQKNKIGPKQGATLPNPWIGYKGRMVICTAHLPISEKLLKPSTKTST